MRKIFPLLGLLICILILSCKSGPGVSGQDQPDGGMLPLTEPSPGDAAIPDDTVSVILPPDEPLEKESPVDLIEPVIEFPEIALPLTPPGEKDDAIRLADVPAPPRESPAMDKPAAATPKIDTAKPEGGIPSPAPGAASPTEKVPEKQPPSTPSFLRPAEPDSSRDVVREPLAVPVNPIPEAPSGIGPLLEDDTIVFSRTVRATVGQLIEIPFRGNGWVFLGELGSRRGIAYDSRRLDPEGQSFIFRAEKAGTYILKFYKEDFIRDYILNDHVQVIIGDIPETSGTAWFNPSIDRGRVVAEPRWPLNDGSAENMPSGIPPAGGQSQSPAETSPAAAATPAAAVQVQPRDEGIIPVTPASPPGTSSGLPVPPATTIVMPAGASPDDYITKAKEEFDGGRVGSAISVLEQFKQRFPSGSDEAFWLLGQYYEANSSYRDIRTSRDYYRRLVNEYPQSRRYNDAQRRIAYLERYYFNIR